MRHEVAINVGHSAEVLGGSQARHVGRATEAPCVRTIVARDASRTNDY
jgi:methyl coenzyme M reductase alpha subunit